MQILLLNGPNLNMLGKREPEVYGSSTLADIENTLRISAVSKGAELCALQSNSEHELIEKIHASVTGIDGIIINPAAFTHTSIALRDALLSVELPFIEVHLSNVHKREAFRQHSYFSDIAIGTIVGLGADGYEYALDAIIKHLQQK
ncbi:MAG: 3-dehydroquinate dehydratase-2 [Alphaproteobacteria bacterium]|jgi:3-dehydroquinate dehydratase-2